LAHTVQQSPINHTAYKQRSENNTAEVATERMDSLLNHTSDENGNGVEALLTIETSTL
jgi:hypothetical protein